MMHLAAFETTVRYNMPLMIVDARISRSVVTLPYRRIHYGQDE